MTGAERVVAFAAVLALCSCVAFAGIALLDRPGDVSNPDAKFDAEKGPGKREEARREGPHRRLARFGYDPGAASSSTPSRSGRPSARSGSTRATELIEFPPIVVDDRLYFIDNDGLYVSLDAETGKIDLEKQLDDAQRLLARLLPTASSTRVALEPGPGARRPRPATARCSGARSSAPAPSPRRWSPAGACTSATRPATSTRSTPRTATRSGRRPSTARSRPRPRSATGSSTSATTAAT